MRQRIGPSVTFIYEATGVSKVKSVGDDQRLMPRMNPFLKNGQLKEWRIRFQAS